MNRFSRIAATVLLALMMSGVMSGASAQGGNGNGRGSRDPDARPSPPRQADVDRRRRQELTPEEREQLRRDIREHGRDVYRDRDRNRAGEGRSRRQDRPQR